MAVDYEAAWDELQRILLSREGWGTTRVLAEMADLRVRHAIPEPETARALRLAAQVASFAPRAVPGADALTDGPTDRSEEDHDGQQHRREDPAGRSPGRRAA